MFGASTGKRERLFESLERFVADVVRPIGLFVAVYIDGSFVTDKPAPSDIDIVIELPRDCLRTLWDKADWMAAVDNKRVKAMFSLDVFVQPIPPGASDGGEFLAGNSPGRGSLA